MMGVEIVRGFFKWRKVNLKFEMGIQLNYSSLYYYYYYLIEESWLLLGLVFFKIKKTKYILEINNVMRTIYIY